MIFSSMATMTGLFGVAAALVFFPQNGVDAAGVRSHRLLDTDNDGAVDVLAEFKNRNLLRDDFANPMQVLESLAGGGRKNSLQATRTMTLDGITFSVEANDLVALPSVFADNARYVLDGIQQPSLPSNVLYAPKNDPSVMVVLSAGTGQFQRALRTNPSTGGVSSLLPISEGLDIQVFAQVDSNDIDTTKLSRFGYGDTLEHTNERALLEPPPRALKEECDSFKIIEVAIAYESRFCEVMGGEDRANQVVQVTVAQASLKFEKLCTKLQLSHLEGYCDERNDPYSRMFVSSVCRNGDTQSILRLFRDYWKTNRAHIPRDIAHLFHGFPHASGTVGCAWAASLCNDHFGYGVNELTFGGNNNPTFWSMLFAHEMGHSAGAGHECCGSLMDASMCSDPGCDEFSDTAIAYMDFHMNSETCISSTEEDGVGIQQAPPMVNQDNNNNNNEDTGFTNDPGWTSLDGTCSGRLGYCNLGPCCEGLNCYNRFICLD